MMKNGAGLETPEKDEKQAPDRVDCRVLPSREPDNADHWARAAGTYPYTQKPTNQEPLRLPTLSLRSSSASRLNAGGYGGLVLGIGHLQAGVFRPQRSGVAQTGGTPEANQSRVANPTAPASCALLLIVLSDAAVTSGFVSR
jgi:hypothetical protein